MENQEVFEFMAIKPQQYEDASSEETGRDTNEFEDEIEKALKSVSDSEEETNSTDDTESAKEVNAEDEMPEENPTEDNVAFQAVEGHFSESKQDEDVSTSGVSKESIPSEENRALIPKAEVNQAKGSETQASKKKTEFDASGRLKVGDTLTENTEKEFYDEPVLSYEEEEKLRLKNLKYQITRKAIIEAKIVGVVPNEKKLSFAVVTSYNGFQVYILDKDFFDEGIFNQAYANMSPEEKYAYKLRRARRMSQARISFILTSVAKESYETIDPITNSLIVKNRYFAKASRNMANAKKRDMYFFNPRGKYKVIAASQNTPGTVVEARILDCQRYGILVEALGVETLITAEKVTAKKYVTDCTTESNLQPGNKIKALIVALDVNTETKTVRMKLSPRAIESNVMKHNISQVVPGTVSMGNVVYSREDEEHRRYYLISLDIGVLGKVHEERVRGGRMLFPGQRVSFIAERVYPDRGYVIGACIPQ